MKNPCAARILLHAVFGLILLAGNAMAHPGHDHSHPASAVVHGFSHPSAATAFLTAIIALAALWKILHLAASRVSETPAPASERNPS